MKHGPPRRRVQVLLPADLYERLVRTCTASGVTRTMYIARAVRERLDDATDKSQLFGRLDKYSDAQAEVQHDVRLLQEAIVTFVQFWFNHMPPSPREILPQARENARDRYKQYIESLANGFRAGHRLVDDFPPEAVEKTTNEMAGPRAPEPKVKA